ncbi:MAG UNVERIFIED_CONTAM: gas vesicle protein [Microcystis novacekii LVE1205-3]
MKPTVTSSTFAGSLKNQSSNSLKTATQGSSLADILERVLDKGIRDCRRYFRFDRLH